MLICSMNGVYTKTLHVVGTDAAHVSFNDEIKIAKRVYVCVGLWYAFNETMYVYIILMKTDHIWASRVL